MSVNCSFWHIWTTPARLKEYKKCRHSGEYGYERKCRYKVSYEVALQVATSL